MGSAAFERPNELTGLLMVIGPIRGRVKRKKTGREFLGFLFARFEFVKKELQNLNQAFLFMHEMNRPPVAPVASGIISWDIAAKLQIPASYKNDFF